MVKTSMKSDNINFDLRALQIYEFALDELDKIDDDDYIDFACKVISWYERHWIVSDDYSTFYSSKRFCRKDGFVFDDVVSELQEILDYHTALVAFHLSKVGD